MQTCENLKLSMDGDQKKGAENHEEGKRKGSSKAKKKRKYQAYARWDGKDEQGKKNYYVSEEVIPKPYRVRRGPLEIQTQKDGT